MIENKNYDLHLMRNPFGDGPFVAIELPQERIQDSMDIFLFLVGKVDDAAIADINQLIDRGKDICRKTGVKSFLAGNEKTAFILDQDGNIL